MTATQTAHCRRNPGNCALEILRQHFSFSCASVENWRDSSAERDVFAPKIHFQATAPPKKEDGAFQVRPLGTSGVFQRVPTNEEVVRSLDPQYLHPDQCGRYYDRVHPVHTNAIHTLEPRESITPFVYEADTGPKIGNCTAGFNSTKDVALCQVLMLNRNRRLAIDSSGPQVFESWAKSLCGE